MKRLLTIIIGLFLLVSLNGQIMRYSNYVAPPSGGLDTAGFHALVTDGHTKGWYNIGDGSATYLTKDGSNLVSAWIDLVGTNDLVQATADYQPVYSSGGITFDGSDDYLLKAFTYVKPEVIYIRFQQVTWADNDAIFDGNSDASIALWQDGTSPTIKLFISGGVASNTDLATGTMGVVRVIYNDANSQIRVNNEDPTTVASGTTGSSGGFKLGDGGGFGNSNIQVQEIILRDQVDTSGNDALIMTYMMRDL